VGISSCYISNYVTIFFSTAAIGHSMGGGGQWRESHGILVF